MSALRRADTLVRPYITMPTQVELIKKYRLSVRGTSGRHILIDPNIPVKIAGLLELEKGDTVLEIGPGLGALTRHLLDHPVRLIAVEKDERFVQILKNELPRKNSFKLIHGDFLEWDGRLLLKDVSFKKGKVKVVSNLPYYITAPILLRLGEWRPFLSRAVLMMQREVARRLVAFPGSKDYGRLTLAVRFAAQVRHAFGVSPSCFTPAPEVDSSVVVLEFQEPSRESAQVDEKALFRLIQTAFSQRRKTLIHLLARDAGIRMTREKLLDVFEKLGWGKDIRGEELSLGNFVELTKILMVK